MMHRSFPVTTAAAAVACLIALSATGCSKREPVAAQGAATVAPPAVEAPPPPTIAAQQEIALTGAGARIADDGLHVGLARSDFAAGGAQFKPQDNDDRMERVARLLKERTELRVIVSAYPDDRGTQKAKEQLAQHRAEAVRDALVTHGHVDASRIEIASGAPSGDPGNGAELRIVDGQGHYASRAAMGPGARPPSQGASQGPSGP